MGQGSSHDHRPAAAFRNAVVAALVKVLGRHSWLRKGFAVVGTILLIIGGVLSPIWNVPLLSWVTAGEVAGPCLAAGSAALGIWYLSRRRSSGEERAVSTPIAEAMAADDIEASRPSRLLSGDA